MFQQPLPPEISRLAPDETDARIATARRCLGEDLIILAHHYQRDEIIKWADYRGDSLKLSQLAGEHPEARYIVFCGVHFMAESADVLTTSDQIVILPNLSAGCSMADMASIRQVQDAWDEIGAVTDTGRIVPITYVNSTAAIKAFVGRNGGACCTSSNARQIIRWALDNGDKIMFFPDQHLGRNTSVALGLDPESDMLLWKGHCSVHARFTAAQIELARREHPGLRVIVHPECSLDVVRAADEYGSTEAILRAIRESPSGTIWAVGTEINLVSRIAREQSDKTVFCLDPVVCPCSTMYRIHPHYLLWTLEALLRGEIVNQITVRPEIAADARLALERMLAIR